MTLPRCRSLTLQAAANMANCRSSFRRLDKTTLAILLYYVLRVPTYLLPVLSSPLRPSADEGALVPPQRVDALLLRLAAPKIDCPCHCYITPVSTYIVVVNHLPNQSMVSKDPFVSFIHRNQRPSSGEIYSTEYLRPKHDAIILR